MQHICTLLIILLVGIMSSEAQLTWSSEYEVASNSQYGKHWAKIVNSNGTPIVMWGNASTDKVYTARWNGNGFNTPIEMTVPGVDAFVDSWAGPGIAAKGDDVFVVFKALPSATGTVYSRKSSDGGLTWGDTVRCEFLSAGFARFPSIAIKDDGNPVITWMEHDAGGGNTKYMSVTSSDGGLTYLPEVECSSIAPGSEVCDCCPAAIEADNGHVTMMFRNNDSNLRDTWFSHSANGGSSYNNAVDMDNTDWNISICPSQGPDGYISGDKLTSVFMSGATSPSRVYVSEVDLNTFTVSTNSQLITTPNPSTAALKSPRIAGSGDTLVIVWEQNHVGNLECAYALSTTGISGLNGTYDTLNMNSGLAQEKPDVSYDPVNRNFHFVFIDGTTGGLVYRKANLGFSGISESNQSSINIHPNPSSTGLFQVDSDGFEGVIQIKIFDLSGKLCYKSAEFGNQFSVNISNLAQGNYLLQLTDANGKLAREKIIR